MTSSRHDWMLYGAYGYTGRLIVEHALNRGHQPLLAGRSEEKLRALAGEMELPYRAFSLDDAAVAAAALSDVDVVLHAAGPFAVTAAPMQAACLQTATHYLDITGEIPVFEATYVQDAEARRRNISLIPGVGFDVVPTECLARYVSTQVRDADELRIAIKALSTMSPGTAKSMLGMLPEGGLARRDGELVPLPLGSETMDVTFPGGQETAVAIPWGDLVTAYRSTHIPNITTYFVTNRAGTGMKLARPLAGLLSVGVVRSLAEKIIDWTVSGPDAGQRQHGRSLVWACAERADGAFYEAWVDTVEAYRFTALASVRAVERVLDEHPVGALTPSQAFGADFVLEIEGTTRRDAIS